MKSIRIFYWILNFKDETSTTNLRISIALLTILSNICHKKIQALRKNEMLQIKLKEVEILLIIYNAKTIKPF